MCLTTQNLRSTLIEKDVIHVHLLKSLSLSQYTATNKQVPSVKAFRSLVSGEDDELKTAYDHFHKAVDREQGVVRNAILVGVEHLKQDTSDVHTDVRANLAVTECIDRNTKNVVAGTGRIHKYFESRIVLRPYSFLII